MDGESPDSDEDERPGQDVADPATRTVRLLSDLCDTCITKPSDRMHMGARRQQFIDAARAADTFVVCHDTGTHTEHPAAICRGYYNRYRLEIGSLRLATAFGFLTEVDPPAVGFVEGRMRAGTED